MAWNQLIVEHEIGPVGVEVKEVDPPFFVLAVGVTLVGEAIDAIAFTHQSFMPDAVDFVSNFLAKLEIGWERLIVGRVVNDRRWAVRYQERHVSELDGESGGIIELDEVGFLVVGDCRIEGNIHDGAGTIDESDRIRAFHTSAGRVGFVLSGSFVTIERAEQAAVPFEFWINCQRRAMRINFVAVWFIELLGARIVDESGVGSGGASNNDAVHRVGLSLGPFDGAIAVVVEVTHGENREPSAIGGCCAVSEKEW